MARRVLDVSVTRTTGATVRVAVDDADPRFAALFASSAGEGYWPALDAVEAAVCGAVTNAPNAVPWDAAKERVSAMSRRESRDQTAAADIDLTAPTEEPTR